MNGKEKVLSVIDKNVNSGKLPLGGLSQNEINEYKDKERYLAQSLIDYLGDPSIPAEEKQEKLEYYSIASGYLLKGLKAPIKNRMRTLPSFLSKLLLENKESSKNPFLRYYTLFDTYIKKVDEKTGGRTFLTDYNSMLKGEYKKKLVDEIPTLLIFNMIIRSINKLLITPNKQIKLTYFVLLVANQLIRTTMLESKLSRIVRLERNKNKKQSLKRFF